MQEKKEVKKVIREIKKLKLKKEEIERQLEERELILKEEMQKQQISEMIIDEYKVRYTEIISNRFDTTSFKKDCAELYNKYIKTQKSMRFSIA